MDLDIVIKKLGGFGKYQQKVYLLLFFPFLHHSICSLTYLFTTGDLNYRCAIPECEGTEPVFHSTWIKSAIPHKNNEIADKCKHYKFIGRFSLDNCSEELFSLNETETCSSYIFENSENTITKEFNLLCQENDWKRTTVGTLNNVAQFIGLPIAGILSDRYGRKFMTVIGVLFSSILGTLRSFSTSYIEFIIYEMLDSMASAGVYCSIFILGIEMISPDMRCFCGVLIGAYYPIGEIILGVVVWLFNDWRQYLRILYLPGLMFILYIWLLPESFRWHISKGRRKEGLDILKDIAQTNGVLINDEIKKVFHSIENDRIINDDSRKSRYPLRDALSSRVVMLRVLNCSYSWITHTLVFYGLSLNSVAIAGNKYLNFILVSSIELPAYLLVWYSINKVGRRLSVVLGLLLSGVSCITFSALPKDALISRLILFMTGKFAISISFTALYIMTSEFFPTEMRNTLLGFCSTLGRFGSMIAPQTPLLAPYVDPVLVFGIASFLAAASGLYFPETSNCQLPDTLDEAEAIGRGSKSRQEK